MADEPIIDSIIPQAVMELAEDGSHNFQVGAFIMPAHIVDLPCPAPGCHQIDGPAVIIHIEPVPNLHTVAVNRKRLMLHGIADHQRDQLLRVLVGAVVVGAAGDVYRHTVGIPEGQHKQVAAGLGGGIGTVGAQRRGLGKEAFGAQSTVDLIGGDLQVFFPRLPASVKPAVHGAAQKIQCAHDVGAHKNIRV